MKNAFRLIPGYKKTGIKVDRKGNVKYKDGTIGRPNSFRVRDGNGKSRLISYKAAFLLAFYNVKFTRGNGKSWHLYVGENGCYVPRKDKTHNGNNRQFIVLDNRKSDSSPYLVNSLKELKSIIMIGSNETIKAFDGRSTLYINGFTICESDSLDNLVFPPVDKYKAKIDFRLKGSNKKLIIVSYLSKKLKLFTSVHDFKTKYPNLNRLKNDRIYSTKSKQATHGELFTGKSDSRFNVISYDDFEQDLYGLTYKRLYETLMKDEIK